LGSTLKNAKRIHGEALGTAKIVSQPTAINSFQIIMTSPGGTEFFRTEAYITVSRNMLEKLARQTIR